MSKRRMLLVGGYGIGNYGDEAILSGLLRNLPYDAKMTAVSHDPAETFRLHKVHSIYPFEALNALDENELVVISGGLFGGHMGKWGRLLPFFCFLSKIRKVGVDFRGLGVYPSTPKSMWPLIRVSSATAQHISVRDKLSAKVLENIGVDDVSVVSDLSFFMAPASKERAAEILNDEGVNLSKRIVGISITRATPALRDEVAETIKAAIKRINDEFEILFIPMCRHKKSSVENDLLYSEQVAEGFSNVKVLSGSYHPSEILAIFGLLERCVCMRLHSMIFAHRMGTPMIPIPYTEKCLEFLKDVDINPVPIKETPKLMRGGR